MGAWIVKQDFRSMGYDYTTGDVVPHRKSGNRPWVRQYWRKGRIEFDPERIVSRPHRDYGCAHKVVEKEPPVKSGDNSRQVFETAKTDKPSSPPGASSSLPAEKTKIVKRPAKAKGRIKRKPAPSRRGKE